MSNSSLEKDDNKCYDNINMDLIVKYKNKEISLSEVVKVCQPGDIIEGMPREYFTFLIIKLRNDRQNPSYSYSTDRRYGEWRMILTGTRMFK